MCSVRVRDSAPTRTPKRNETHATQTRTSLIFSHVCAHAAPAHAAAARSAVAEPGTLTASQRGGGHPQHTPQPLLTGPHTVHRPRLPNLRQDPHSVLHRRADRVAQPRSRRRAAAAQSTIGSPAQTGHPIAHPSCSLRRGVIQLAYPDDRQGPGNATFAGYSLVKCNSSRTCSSDAMGSTRQVSFLWKMAYFKSRHNLPYSQCLLLRPLYFRKCGDEAARLEKIAHDILKS